MAETSSPLAAMQSSSMMGHFGFNPHSSYQFGHLSPVGLSPSFAFSKPQPLTKSASDYFASRPQRSTSPTSSLAADLSQNFHIDRTPQTATPRKTLFSSSHLGHLQQLRETVTTPPCSSSSPVGTPDAMEISPLLPHKLPFANIAMREIVEEKPLPPPPLMISAPIARPKSNPPQMGALRLPERLLNFERKKLARPTFRSKNNSSSAVPTIQKVNPFGQMTQFASARDLSSKLNECFNASPPPIVEEPQERKLSLSGRPPTFAGGSRPRLTSSKTSFGNPYPSPSITLMNPTRQSSAPMPTRDIRPRKHCRRSLSMFSKATDVVNQQSNCDPLSPVMDIDEEHKLVLPHFTPDDCPGSLPRISKQTMVEVLDGRYKDKYEDTIIVDCRFEYEYDGGHIEGAVNFNDRELLAKKLFDTIESTPSNALLIFHCEYSACRAPMVAKHVRQHDRTINAHRYPALSYPEIYILDGGYSAFFLEHRMRCFPQNYIEMNVKEHSNTCERLMGRFQRRGKISRATTFTIGVGAPNNNVEESPTSAGIMPKTARESFSWKTASDEDLRSQMKVKRVSSFQI